jgi:hypothetical protein
MTKRKTKKSSPTGKKVSNRCFWLEKGMKKVGKLMRVPTFISIEYLAMSK